MRRAIVTGGASGLGSDMASALISAGYQVGVMDIDREQTEATASRLGNAIPLVASVSDNAAVEAAFAQFGEAPDLLINNAGIVRIGPLHEQTVSDYTQVIETNLLGPSLCSRIAAKGMIARGSGHIINITSVNGIHPAPGVGLYAATKAALHSLTQLMSLEWGPLGIRVNSIAPGFIDAGMSKTFFEDPKVRDKRSSGVPLRSLGTASDITNAMLFLDSAAAQYITGNEIVVDGGVTNSVFAHLPRD
ncbi:MAG: SDR family oxidoreductase [Porticoccaceae bacterium]|jgi:3-oxoacyl-[acyl-carrier protein] reductase|nr:SDR family oxidoreductase [Porticoccaceae bacterium]|tara:strand:+ start:5410 stop:6150 length:741 start_codon:yes stop_codon:yes gene_type:complete